MIFFIYTLAASPLASSGFAAIGCFRALPYDDIYIIILIYSKMSFKKSECKIKFGNRFFQKTEKT